MSLKRLIVIFCDAAQINKGKKIKLELYKVFLL